MDPAFMLGHLDPANRFAMGGLNMAFATELHRDRKPLPKLLFIDIMVEKTQHLINHIKHHHLVCKCRFLILFFHMFSYLFLINRTIFVRETSFQQVLLSSSGPKENIFISKFIYPTTKAKAITSAKT